MVDRLALEMALEHLNWYTVIMRVKKGGRNHKKTVNLSSGMWLVFGAEE